MFVWLIDLVKPPTDEQVFLETFSFTSFISLCMHVCQIKSLIVPKLVTSAFGQGKNLASVQEILLWFWQTKYGLDVRSTSNIMFNIKRNLLTVHTRRSTCQGILLLICTGLYSIQTWMYSAALHQAESLTPLKYKLEGFSVSSSGTGSQLSSSETYFKRNNIYCYVYNEQTFVGRDATTWKYI